MAPQQAWSVPELQCFWPYHAVLPSAYGGERSPGNEMKGLKSLNMVESTGPHRDTESQPEIDGQQVIRGLHRAPRIAAELEGDIVAHEMIGELTVWHELR